MSLVGRDLFWNEPFRNCWKPSRLDPAESAAKPAMKGVQIRANDPAQHLSRDGDEFTLSGVTTNNGFARSMLVVELDGSTISVGLDRRMTPNDTLDALEKALPRAYTLSRAPQGSSRTADVVFTIEKA